MKHKFLITCILLPASWLLACNSSNTNTGTNASATVAADAVTKPAAAIIAANTGEHAPVEPAPIEPAPVAKTDTIIASAILFVKTVKQVDGYYDSVQEAFKDCGSKAWQPCKKKDILNYFSEPQCDEVPKFTCLERTVDIAEKVHFEEIPSLHVNIDAVKKVAVIKDNNNNVVKNHPLKEAEYKNAIIMSKRMAK